MTTTETREVWRLRAPLLAVLRCHACVNGADMLTPHEAAINTGVSQRTIYRWIEDGRIHFVETTDGSLFVCLTSAFDLKEGG